MSQPLRTSLTLAVLVLLLVVAAVWGWSAATEPLPGKADPPICVATPVSKGDRIRPNQVTVSVYNAGRREGLAGRTRQLLTDRGFAGGPAGNVTGSRVRTAEIWTESPDSPAVSLVASVLGKKVKIRQRTAPGVGVTVVVGDDFRKLVKGKRAVSAVEDTEICSPPVE